MLRIATANAIFSSDSRSTVEKQGKTVSSSGVSAIMLRIAARTQNFRMKQPCLLRASGAGERKYNLYDP